MIRVDYEDLDKYENYFLATDIFVDGKILLCKSSILNKTNLDIIKNNKDKIIFKFYIYSDNNDKDEYENIVTKVLSTTMTENLDELLKYYVSLSDDDIKLNQELIILLLKKICKERFYINYLGNILLCNEILFRHLIRVATLSALLSIKAKLPTQMIIDITIGAILHDIGKFKLFIKYPSMNNPKRLYSEDEYKLLQSHPAIGYEELENNELVPMESKKIVLLHHVWEDQLFSYNNTKQEYMSYPEYYKTQQISPQLKDIGVSIVQVSNLYDNLVNFEDYENMKPSKERIVEYIINNDKQISGNGAGGLLDSVIFKANVGDKVLLSNGKIATITKMQKIPKQPVVNCEGEITNLLHSNVVVKKLIKE